MLLCSVLLFRRVRFIPFVGYGASLSLCRERKLQAAKMWVRREAEVSADENGIGSELLDQEAIY